MDIIFKKLSVQNRFDITFEDWRINNNITFSQQGFVNIYASNGVGKSSFAKALKNEIKAEYEYDYNGNTYTEKSKDTPVMIIDDFFFRNIATRDNEKLSDYILGSQIAKELELKEKIENATQSIKDSITTYLKKEYGIKTKDSNFSSMFNNDGLIVFVNSVANTKDKGKDYDAERLLELKTKLTLNTKLDYEISKYEYIKENLEEKNSLIKQVIDFDTNDINAIEGFSKLDIDNDAIEILKKHEDIKTCIFEDTHILPTDIKDKLEKNKKAIIDKLNLEQKKIIERILDLKEDPLKIKETFNSAFEIGEISKINSLASEIKNIILQIENSIITDIVNIIKESKLKELYVEFKELIKAKIELSSDDELLLKNIIENCINKKVDIRRDKNKNIIFTLENNNFIGKSRQELPLSTGEQNFISLYFELLAAKNSDKDIIIIDDPISSFDSIYKNKIIYSIIKVLIDKKVIILTHNINTIKLMQHQYKDCFNLYLLNNEKDGNNGFIKIDKKETSSSELKDMDLMLEIKNVIQLFSNDEFINDIKDEKQFLLSTIPFMRSYTNLLHECDIHYKDLCKLMHGYETEKIDINTKFKEIFGIDIIKKEYKVNVEDILNIEINQEIVDNIKYPLLNRTLIHILNYLKLRLMVENTLYKTDPSKLEIKNNPQLHKIIEIYLKNNDELKSVLLSKKTLLNEFNHFEYDMCLFMPSLDISDSKLKEEKQSIIQICKDIKNNGI